MAQGGKRMGGRTGHKGGEEVSILGESKLENIGLICIACMPCAEAATITSIQL